jgi:hypothetical protein
MAIYIGGSRVANGSKVGATVASAHSFSIGARNFSGSFDGSSTYLTGLLDDVRIYNRARAADEIKRLYNMGR